MTNASEQKSVLHKGKSATERRIEMNSIKMILPAMLLIALAGCASDHNHKSNPKFPRLKRVI